MANEIIPSNLTTTYTVDSFDIVYVPVNISVTTSSTPAIQAATGGQGMTLFVDGTLTSLGWFGGTIAFGTTQTLSNMNVTIGSTGRVNGVFAGGVQVTGSGSYFTNHGTVTSSGFGTGVEMFCANADGNFLTFLNTGSISGDTGVLLDGRGAEGVNDGTITGVSLGLNLALYFGSFLNAGLVSGSEDGVHVAGQSPDFMNTGRIEVLGAGIRSFVSEAIITNSGEIAAGGLGIRAALGSGGTGEGITVTNTGTITAEEGGIEVLSNNATVQAGGTIDAGLTGVLLTGNNAILDVAGDIRAGGNGVNLTGNDAQLRISGSVAGNLAGVGLWGVTVTGDDLQLHLSGSVAGYNGIQVAGGSADIVNLGVVEGLALGLGITYTGVTAPPPSLAQVLNAGTITGSVAAISVTNDRLDLVNSGTLHSLGSSAISTLNGARIVNTGTISVGPNGSAAFSSLGNETDVIRNFGTMLGDALVAAGSDVVRNRGLIDGAVDLSTGNDLYDGRHGNVTGLVEGDLGADTLLGGDGTDSLSGGKGSDVLSGGGGNDRLSGGTSRDTLTGGGGEDIFVFQSVGEAGSGAQRDVITDLNASDDVIDLSAFMTGGSFIGTAAFTAGGAANRVRYDTATRLIEGDLNGDGTADFQIDVTGLRGTLTAANFDFVV